MTIESESGGGGRFTKAGQGETRLQVFEREFFDLIAHNGTVAEMFAAAVGALKGAEMTIRAADPSTERGWSYKSVPDHAIRLAAFNSLAKVLRLVPTSGGVTVNTSNQTLTITPAADTVAELASLGVTREQLAGACQELLTAVDGDRVSHSANKGQQGGK